uniref:(California timema) hypothetical protein n=1 Tax=Timema californicum TaxID=61474 RepID=A0A7R9JDD8_TIMCA|nr:unnamed protein product [Timema californicum]
MEAIYSSQSESEEAWSGDQFRPISVGVKLRRKVENTTGPALREELSFDDMTSQMHSHVKECEAEKNVKKEECMKQVKASNGKKLKLSGGCEVDDKGKIDNAKLNGQIDTIEDDKKKELVNKIVADCKEEGIDIEDGCEAMNAVAGCSYVSYMVC